MKKKKMLFMFFLFSVLFFTQTLAVCLAKPMPLLEKGYVVEKNGYVISEPMYMPPVWGGDLYGYRSIDPESISYLEENGRKTVYFEYHYLDGKKLKDYGSMPIELDLYNNVYRKLNPRSEWIDLEHKINQCNMKDPRGCWNTDVTDTVRFFVSYLKENYHDFYNAVIASGQIADEKADAVERERLMPKLDAAYQNAQAGLETIATIGTDVTWESFSSEYVDNSKVPPLSELMGHVFLLSDSYGFKTVRMNNSIVLKTDKRRNALVHFLPIKHPDGYWMISLMDDTGEFAGKEYINRKPIVVRFRAYQEDYGYYKGMDDRFIKTGSFNTLGSVVGGANLVEGLTNEGYVNIGIEKTDEAGKYRLVYYVTRITWDDYGNQHVITNKQNGYYATLTLVK